MANMFVVVAGLLLTQACGQDITYLYGPIGVDACSTGAVPITDEATCRIASQKIGDPYKARHSNKKSGAVCNGRLCGPNGCRGTRLSTSHRGASRWLCMKADPTCRGNDSRCANATNSSCDALQDEGADCWWEANPDYFSGSCLGSDSRCANESKAMCEHLIGEGASCRWDNTTASNDPGVCHGNDSRCAGSTISNCIFLQNGGADCWWEGVPDYSGSCLGNDSRCANSSKAVCEHLIGEGTSCRWDNTTASNETGVCNGNDSRCDDATKSNCMFLQGEGADCWWEANPDYSGSCLGNDSRCANSSKAVCEHMIGEGTSCRWDNTTASNETGVCNGYDSRCEDATKSNCMFLQGEGADCWWEANPDYNGTCLGNDSRCANSSKAVCEDLIADGASCRWENVTSDEEGKCRGNDSRCADSTHATCIWLSGEGADCWWEYPEGATNGTCAGNDSRCSGETEQMCTRLNQTGADCVWREHYSVDGTFEFEVNGTNGTRRLQSVSYSEGCKQGLSDLTGVPPGGIYCDATLQSGGTIRADYVIVVDNNVPYTVVVTDDDMGQLLHMSNNASLGSALVSGIQKTTGATVSVTIKKSEVTIAIILPTQSSESSESSENSATSAVTVMTSTSFQSLDAEALDGSFQAGVSYLWLLLPILMELLIR